MKQALQALLTEAINTLKKQGILSSTLPPIELRIEEPRSPTLGDFSSNLAMILAKSAKRNARELATLIIEAIPENSWIEKINLAGPGFINFYMRSAALTAITAKVLQEKTAFGRNTQHQNKKLLLEFVSSNPTGPLHVGHGRQAAFGSCVGNLLAACGYQVYREYYVNDAGRQMAILAVSVWLRYLEHWGEQIIFPVNGYKGNYVITLANHIAAKYQQQFFHTATSVFADLPPDEGLPEGDKERHIDALIAKAKTLLGETDFTLIYDFALNAMVDEMRDDLAEFSVTFDQWFSERSLMTSGAVNAAIEALTAKGVTYEKDHALWFRATAFGDEKDRVLVRANGQKTYFASDVAYHFQKLQRGFDVLINIFGSDHHGYVSRLQASVKALTGEEHKLQVILVQFVSLYRGGEKASMSTRAGSFITLRELRHEVGNDAARLFYIYHKNEQHLDFDLDLAKSKSNENPVFYIQYAHARICSVFSQLAEKGWIFDENQGLANQEKLQEPHEIALFRTLGRYPEMVAAAALQFAPHLLAHYLRDLANDLHSYYNSYKFLVDDAACRNARLCLISAVKQVLQNGLTLLGITAPETM